MTSTLISMYDESEDIDGITRPMELELELNLNPSPLKKTKLHSPVNFKWPNSPAVEKTPSTNSTSASSSHRYNLRARKLIHPNKIIRRETPNQFCAECRQSGPIITINTSSDLSQEF
uniref:Uncharacterized protein n=1 Tax=Strigamia maritima TaxID=126957 RepID=T1J185_STRMM